jgi:hypothetical protein
VAARDLMMESLGSFTLQASDQIVCDDRLCHPVERGCHIEFRSSLEGGGRSAAAATSGFATEPGISIERFEIPGSMLRIAPE